MMDLTDEQREELKRKVQEEKVERVQKRLSTKASITVLVLLIYGFGWWNIRGMSTIETIVYVVVAGLVSIFLAVWVYRDARRRPMNL